MTAPAPTLLYRKYSVSVSQDGISRSTILHTQADMLGALLTYTAEGATVTVQERWLEDQGAGPTEGEPRTQP
ncbi:hypothetical protein MF271_19045 (plasmid) [Deinococcus sp. KNUC1210]|uniref:hypothetical protein n=1 Tax=Deinococcus sp. KNUC1210 TaxID=2917691 RepID=UPI001EEFA16C|nr:hypothetical protein [Deinococcus sp. KNUC1210]ULH17418.1 hypothetical protein MF271_19045 [Deinococcus sp. KNUC1210]